MNSSTISDIQQAVRCPDCQSDVLYRYGHTEGGKQKYLCVICNRQFVSDSGRCTIKDRPLCTQCGQPMHVYMQCADYTRFRCSAYPRCRGFIKLAKEG